jgi:hypothetical protein
VPGTHDRNGELLFILNLNFLYSSETPTIENEEKYIEKVEQLIPNNPEQKPVAVLITGTAPRWLTLKVVVYLFNRVDFVYYDIGTEIPYLVTDAKADRLLIKKLKGE